MIAVIWDFDLTLAKEYMQRPIFEKFQVNGDDFWKENKGLYEKYKEKGIKLNKDTTYLNHLLTCVEQGIFKGLNNAMLRELGREIQFYEGLPDFFQELKLVIESNDSYKKYNITLEHYIISTGLVEMIKGSEIAPFVDGIWGCEFIEEPIKSTLDIKEFDSKTNPEDTVIKQIAYAIDNTSKTRAIFEINKGVNKHPEIDVNAKLLPKMRRIPFKNMIYIADGPSDVPVFSLLQQAGGKTFAVYPAGELKYLKQVDRLREDNRIDMYGEADYREGTLTNLWITEKAEAIANRIFAEKEEAIRRNITPAPGHIV